MARKFIKFCLIGGSGVVVDMGVLFLLSDPRCLGLNITLSKICAAEAAMISNFIWNEIWTFQSASDSEKGNTLDPLRAGVARRFFVFNLICTAGICLAVLLLHAFHTRLGVNLYLSNSLAIFLVTFWNFALNFRWTWHATRKSHPQ